MSGHRLLRGRPAIVAGMTIAALAGAVLLRAGSEPAPRRPITRITCPAATTRGADTIASLLANARCSGRARIGERHPLLP